MGWKHFKTQSDAIEYPPSPSGITHVHNHNYPPSVVGEVVGKVMLYVLLGVAGWYAGVFLMGKAGFSDPELAMAGLLVWGTLGLALALAVSRVAEGQIARYYAHQEAMEDRRTEQMRYQQLMMSSVVTDSRVIGEDSRLIALAYEIMRQAYAYRVKNNAPFVGKWRPWSRRNAAEIRLPGESKPAGEGLASKAATWLLNKEVIVNDQINLKYYPDLGSVQRLLYNPPVLITPQSQKGASNE